MLQEWFDFLWSTVDKWLYVNGAQGQFGTVEYIKEHEAGDHEIDTLALRNKRIAAGVPQQEIRCADCSGLGRYFEQNIKHIYSYDTTASGMYGESIHITKNQLKAGDKVFHYRITSGIHHVGYVVEKNGILYVIESANHEVGVVARPLSAGCANGYQWNRFGRPKHFAKEIELGINKTEDEIMINANSDTALKKAWQIDLEEVGFKGDMDATKYGSWGSKTEAATKAFQKSVGLPQTGVVDAWTFQKMVDLRVAKASDAEKVKTLEAQVASLNTKVSSQSAWISGVKAATSKAV